MVFGCKVACRRCRMASVLKGICLPMLYASKRQRRLSADQQSLLARQGQDAGRTSTLWTQPRVRPRRPPRHPGPAIFRSDFRPRHAPHAPLHSRNHLFKSRHSSNLRPHSVPAFPSRPLSRKRWTCGTGNHSEPQPQVNKGKAQMLLKSP